MANQNASYDDQSDQSAAETARLNRVPEPTIPNIQTTSALPGRRLKNPLGDFASYTYQLTLYMITPDAYGLFIASGRKNINSANLGRNSDDNTGVFIVAQSAGINNNERRAPGMKYDYYIDQLKITQAISAKANQTTTNTSDVEFKIYEPYGFSFTTQLNRAFETIKKASTVKGYGSEFNANPTKQFFIIGIRFQGYGPNGIPLNAANQYAADTFNISGASSGVFERYYDVLLSELKFTLNGSATTYHIKGKTIAPNVSFGQKYGVIGQNIEIAAGTVEEALVGNGSSLIQGLNKNQQNRNIPIKYNLAFIGNDNDVSRIKSASLINPGNTDKKRQPSSSAQTSSQVNEAAANRTVPQTTRRTYAITQDMPITQAIDNIIKQSSYLTDAVTVLTTSSLTPNDKTKTNNVVEKNKNPPPIKWYNLSSIVDVTGYDSRAADFSYIITYVIQPYDTPATYNSVTKASPYYGPSKRYEYWFTGKNSEIINYTQTLDNTYFQIAFDPKSDPVTHAGTAQVAAISGKRNDQDRSGTIDKGSESINEYTTSLSSPGDWGKAKITILGDPDFLMQDSIGSLDAPYQQFYGENFTINPNGGQVFIEIDFKEGIDYNNESGLLDINESIYMNGPIRSINNKTKVTGVAYLLNLVTSSFSGGKFTQVLDCVMTTTPYTSDSANADNRNSENVTAVNATPTSGTKVAQGSGYSLVQPITSGILQVPTLNSSVLKAGYGSAGVNNYLGPTGTFLDGRQRNLAPDDAALSAGAGTTQAGKVDDASLSVNQRLSALSQRVSAFFKPGTAPPARAPGSVPGGVTRINPSDIQPI